MKNKRKERALKMTIATKFERTIAITRNRIANLTKMILRSQSMPSSETVVQNGFKGMTNWQRHQMRKAHTFGPYTVDEVEKYSNLKRNN